VQGTPPVEENFLGIYNVGCIRFSLFAAPERDRIAEMLWISFYYIYTLLDENVHV